MILKHSLSFFTELSYAKPKLNNRSIKLYS